MGQLFNRFKTQERAAQRRAAAETERRSTSSRKQEEATRNLVERIRAALGECPNDNLSGLATVLVEQAVNLRRKNGTIGTPAEVKRFIYALTSGMVDIAHGQEPDPKLRAYAVDPIPF